MCQYLPSTRSPGPLWAEAGREGRAEIPRTVELAVTCLQILHRKSINDSRPTKLEIEEVHVRMEKRRAEVKAMAKKR